MYINSSSAKLRSIECPSQQSRTARQSNWKSVWSGFVASSTSMPWFLARDVSDLDALGTRRQIGLMPYEYSRTRRLRSMSESRSYIGI